MALAVILPAFGFVTIHGAPIPDGPAAEDEWIARSAATGRAAAHWWQGAPGLIVARNCMAAPGWASAVSRHAVQIRASGGGVVPQGPGIANLSLTWAVDASAPGNTDALYAALCNELAAALGRLGIAAAPQAVEGSFCDGRFNLACGGRKLAGTAQSWRRVQGRMIVLAHAVAIVSADPAELAEAANAFERDLGREQRYRAEALTSVAQAWQQQHGRPCPADLHEQLGTAIAERLARVVPPRAAKSSPAAA